MSYVDEDDDDVELIIYATEATLGSSSCSHKKGFKLALCNVCGFCFGAKLFHTTFTNPFTGTHCLLLHTSGMLVGGGTKEKKNTKQTRAFIGIHLCSARFEAFEKSVPLYAVWLVPVATDFLSRAINQAQL